MVDPTRLTAFAHHQEFPAEHRLVAAVANVDRDAQDLAVKIAGLIEVAHLQGNVIDRVALEARRRCGARARRQDGQSLRQLAPGQFPVVVRLQQF